MTHNGTNLQWAIALNQLQTNRLLYRMLTPEQQAEEDAIRERTNIFVTRIVLAVVGLFLLGFIVASIAFWIDGLTASDAHRCVYGEPEFCSS